MVIVWWSGLVVGKEVVVYVVEVEAEADDDELLGGREKAYLYSC